MYHDILIFFFAALFHTYVSSADTEEDRELRKQDSYWQSVLLLF